MPKYKVNFVRATFYPQVLGEKIVQSLMVNGTHYANTSRKISHSNYLGFTWNLLVVISWGFMLNIKRKIPKILC